MRLEYPIEIECEGTYSKGCEAKFHKSTGSYSAPEDAEVNDFTVYLRKIKKDKQSGKASVSRIDITEMLSTADYNDLYNQYLYELKRQCELKEEY